MKELECNMKKITILAIFALMFSGAMAQTRTGALQLKTTADSSLYFIVDSAKWTNYKKMKLSTVTSLEANQRILRDDSIRLNVGLSTGFDFIPDSTSNYLTASDFAAYGLGQTIKNALSILDDTIAYTIGVKNLWENGSGTDAIQQASANDSSKADGAFTFNTYNIATGDNSTAHGKYALAAVDYSRAFSSGRLLGKYGSTQYLEFVVYGSTVGNTTDTLLIAGTNDIDIPTDAVFNVHVEIVGVQYGGTSGAIGRGFTQNWYLACANAAGTSALIGVPDSTTAERGLGMAGTVAITVDDATENLNIKCTGEADKNYYWVAYIRVTMVGFRNFNLGY